MKILSISSLMTHKGRLLSAIVFGISLCLMFGVAHAINTSALESSEDSNAKVAVGEANAEPEATAAADPIKACGPVPKDKDGSAWGKYFKVNGVNMRRSPNLKAKICGQGQKSHKVDYHCWTYGSDGRTWTYVRNATTHYAGWVRDDLLVGRGSLVRC